jgi:hypothetical protein
MGASLTASGTPLNYVLNAFVTASGTFGDLNVAVGVVYPADLTAIATAIGDPPIFFPVITSGIVVGLGADLVGFASGTLPASGISNWTATISGAL